MTPTIARLLHTPASLPSPQWLRDQLIWADAMGAIWPDHEPTPLTALQETSLAEIRMIQSLDADVFQPQSLDEKSLATATSHLARRQMPPRTTATPPSAPAAALPDAVNNPSTATTGLLDPSSSDAPETWLSDDAALDYLHYGKLPQRALTRLEKIGALVPDKDGYGYRCTEPGTVAALLVAAASDLAATHNWTVAADAPATVFELLPPATRRTNHAGLRRDLPALPAVRTDVDVRHLLDLRGESKFATLRETYLSHLAQVQRAAEALVADLSAATNPSDIAKLVRQEYQIRFNRELVEANRALWQRIQAADLLEMGIACVSTTVSAMAALSAPGWATVTAVAADLGDVAMRVIYALRQVHPFLRNYRSVLVHPPAQLA